MYYQPGIHVVLVSDQCFISVYLQCDAPVQFMFLGVPQTHLAVVTAGEEVVHRRVSGESPHLIHMTLHTHTLSQCC